MFNKTIKRKGNFKTRNKEQKLSALKENLLGTPGSEFTQKFSNFFNCLKIFEPWRKIIFNYDFFFSVCLDSDINDNSSRRKFVLILKCVYF